MLVFFFARTEAPGGCRHFWPDVFPIVLVAVLLVDGLPRRRTHTMHYMEASEWKEYVSFDIAGLELSDITT
jgi:hypothetical protein